MVYRVPVIWIIGNKMNSKHTTSNTKRPVQSCCPWWSSKFGLSHYVSSINHLKARKNVTLDLSFWPLENDDLVQIVKGSDRHFSHLCFRGCDKLTDEGIHYLAENWSLRTNNNGRKSYLAESSRQKRRDNETMATTIINPNNIADDTRLWRHLNQNLTCLDLCGCHCLTDGACKAISLFTRLESLDLSDCDMIGDRGLTYLMDGCKYLQEINLRNLFRLQDEGLAYVRRNLVLMKLLRRINLSGCRGFTNEGIANLLESDSDPGVIHSIDLSNTNLELGIGLNSNCKVIKLRNLPRILDSTFTLIAAGCKGLQSIDISGTHAISDYFLAYLFKGCARLKSINMSNCHTLTDEAFKVIEPSAGRRVQELFLTNCEKLTSVSFTVIAISFPNLIILNLEGIPKVSDCSVVCIAQHCRMLRKLILSKKRSGTSTSSNILQIGPKGIFALGKNCPDLQVLQCDCCCRIDDSSVIVLAKGCPLLEEISFRQCYKLGDRSLHAIGKNCHQLRVIDISSCKEITDAGIIELCRGCRHLEEIDFSNLRLTDNAIMALATFHDSLRVIILRNCFLLTDHSLHTLLSNCRYLERADAYGVDLLTDRAFSDVCLHHLRHCNFGGTNVSEYQTLSLAKHSWYGHSVLGKLMLKPIHTYTPMHRQHKEYIAFLRHQQLAIYCAIKKRIVQKRIERRRYLRIIASEIVQRNVRKYIQRLRQKDSMILNAQKQSLDIIVSLLRSRMKRREFVESRIASIRIQRHIRGHQRRVRFRQDLRVKARLEKYFSDIAQAKKTKEPELRECNCALWRRLLLGLIAFDGIRKKVLVSRIQRSFCRYQKKKMLKMKFASWGISTRMQQNMIVWRQCRSAIRIQRYFRHHFKQSLILKEAIQNYEKERILYYNALKVARSVHGWWMQLQSRLLLESMRREKNTRVIRATASVTIQCWYRMLWSRWLACLKRIIVKRWALLVTFKVKLASAILIQHYYRSWRKKQEYRNAALSIAWNLSNLFHKYQTKENDRRERHLHALIFLQSQIRGFLRKRRFNFVLSAVSSIQCAWRFYKARTVFKRLYKESLISQAGIDAKEKEMLRTNRIERKIAILFANTKRDAAIIIQQRYRKHLEWKHQEKARMMIQAKEDSRRKEEADRLNDILRHKQDNRKLKTVTKKLLKTAMTSISAKVNNLSSLMMVAELNDRRRERLEKNSTAVELVRHHQLLKSNEKSSSILQNSTLVKYRQSLQDIFGNYQWFDKKCENVMLLYVLWPEDIYIFRSLWIDTLDFKKEECVTIHDFFDYISEPQTAYGLWLFEAAGLKKDSSTLFHLNFSAYILLVCYCATLNKSDLVKLLFSSSIECKGRDYLSLQEWSLLLKVMLNNEKIRYPIRTAVNAYEIFASRDVHGRNVLYYSDFVRIIQQSCPFVITPILRLHKKIKTHHLGENFWRAKSREIQVAQEAILYQKNEKK